MAGSKNKKMLTTLQNSTQMQSTARETAGHFISTDRFGFGKNQAYNRDLPQNWKHEGASTFGGETVLSSIGDPMGATTQ